MTLLKTPFRCAALLIISTGAIVSMTSSAWAAEAHASPMDLITLTPVWVWFILVALVVMGLRAARPRIMGISGIVIWPALMTCYAMSRFLTMSLDSMMLLAAIVSAPVGGLLAVLLERGRPAKALGNARIGVPGGYATLVIMLSIFLVRYISGVIEAMAPQFAAQQGFLVFLSASSTLFAGLLVTRTVMRVTLALSEGSEPAQLTQQS